MDEQKRPRAREKRIVNGGKGVEKQGKGIGSGPVNNMGNYEKRREQEAASAVPKNASAQQTSGQARTPGGFPHFPGNGSIPMGQRPAQNNGMNSGQRPAQTGNPFSQSSGRTGIPTGGQGQATGKNNAPMGQAQAPYGGTKDPRQAAKRPVQTGGGIPQNQHAHSTVQHGSSPSSGRRPATGGGGGKLLLIIAALVVLFGGGRLSGLLGGETNLPQTFENSGNTGSSGYSSNQGTGSGNAQNGGSGTDYGTGTDISNLLNTLLGGGSSIYDFSGNLNTLSGSGQSNGSGTVNAAGDIQADETVASGAREKYTKIIGNGRDTITLLVYMCGTDLESQNGMGTADLKEMAKASLGNQINLLVYTGGCRRWQNRVVSSQVNQIYQIEDGKLTCLEENMGTGAMTTPATLTRFIQYGKEHFPANRMALILWDHGGGSVSGYGYDEKNGRSSMTLAGINNALKAADVKFDFIGFDACLMATVENGLMLGQYADYMIASEETEPGVGWYYTNWLTKLGKNTSMPTLQIGKNIADDFIQVCAQQCRGQATTLSVVDLAELQETLPKALRAFSADTSDKIQKKEYQAVSSARAGTREFAQSTKIDQIDLKHFAMNMKSDAGRALADALDGAVKYNRTGGGMTNAYGLSIYFPYKRAGKVSQMVDTYEAIGMEAEYTRCIQAFASMEVSGQIAAGTPISSYSLNGSNGFSGGSALDGLLGSLMGASPYSSGSSGYGNSSHYGNDMAELIGSLFGGNSADMAGTGLADLFGSRAINAENVISYILENHIDTAELVWQDQRIHLSDQQWGLVESIVKNVFVDDGKGFIDLGCDSDFKIEGNELVGEDDGTWLSINGQPVAYYYLGTTEDEDSYRIDGYVPAYLNGTRVNLMIVFDDEHPYGTITGAQKVYTDGTSDTQAKNMIQVGSGDQVRFICDYFDYERNYQDTYYLGNPLTLGDEIIIGNTPIGEGGRVTYCFTDLYQQQYWTPVL